MGQRFSRALLAVFRFVARIGRAIPSTLCDLAVLAGAAAVSYGAWLIYQPAGFITGGLLLCAGGVLLGMKFTPEKS